MSAFFPFTAPEQAAAGESRLIGSVALREEYNDNIFLDAEGGKRDFITTISPGLKLEERTERLDFSLFGRLDGIRYGRNEELNTVDYFYGADFAVRADERTTLSAGAGGGRDSRPDRDIDETGLVLGTAPRGKWSFLLGGSRVLSERSSLSVQYNQAREDFDSPKFTDSRGQGASINFIRSLSEILQGRASFGFGRYSYETSETEGYRWTLGGEGALSEKWSTIVDLGISRVRSKFQVTSLRPVFFSLVPVTEEKTNTSWGGVGQISLQYRDDSTGAGISFDQGIQPASGTGAVWNTSLRLFLDRRFTRELSGFLSASYFINRADAGEFSPNEVNTDTLSLGCRVEYRFHRDMTIEASYGYARTMDHNAGTDADRSLFLIRFFVQEDLLDFFR